MATVPDNYTSPRIQQTGLPQAAFEAPRGLNAAPSQAMMIGQAEQQAAQGLSKIQLDINAQVDEAKVNDAMTQATEARLRYTTSPETGYVHLHGANALERPDKKPLDEEYGEKLKADVDKISNGLGNDTQRRSFKVLSDRLRLQFKTGIDEHIAKEFGTYRLDVQNGAIGVSQAGMGLDYGDPAALAGYENTIRKAIAEKGSINGWDANEIKAAEREALSPGHAAAVLSMLQAGRTQYASEYLKQKQDQLTPAARLDLIAKVDTVDGAVRGDAAADAAWLEAGPKGPNDAVRVFEMEKLVRDKTGSEPKIRDAALAGIRQRAQAFNAQQSETNAANVNTVFGLIDSGTPIARVQASPAWLALPEAKRHEVTKSLESDAYTREARGAAREQRALAQMQREQGLLLLKNGDAYLRYSDPETLSSMTRAQVEALRPTFGLEATQHLLTKFESMQKGSGKLEAKIDTEDFNHIADQLGLRPFDATKSEDQKRQLGELKFRVEQLIDVAQTAKNGPLTRDEKGVLMRQEMARKVTVDRWILPDVSVPVIQLNRADAANVKVPPAERERIVEDMRVRYQKTQRKDLEPTEENIRAWYLLSQGPAGALAGGQ